MFPVMSVMTPPAPPPGTSPEKKEERKKIWNLYLWCKADTSNRLLIICLYVPLVSQSWSLSRCLSSSAFASPSERTMVSISRKVFRNSSSVQWSKLQCPHSFRTSERTFLALVWIRDWKTDALSRIPNTADRSHVLSNPANAQCISNR